MTGTDQQTQTVLDQNALVHFHKLLADPKSSIQKEAAWTISNITAGQPHQIQAVVDAGLIKPIIEIVAKVILFDLSLILHVYHSCTYFRESTKLKKKLCGLSQT